MNKLLQKFLFLKENRLLTQRDYHHVFSKGSWRSNLYLSVVISHNQFGIPRLGLRISKRCVKKAVDRNRVKRIVRQSFRLNQYRLNDLDVVILAKKGIASLSNIELEKHLDALWASI